MFCASRFFPFLSFTFDSRSSLPELFLGKTVLKICSEFTGEHPCRSAILIKLLCNFIEITLRHGRSPVNLQHIFGTPFYKEHLWRAAFVTAKKEEQIYDFARLIHSWNVVYRIICNKTYFYPDRKTMQRPVSSNILSDWVNLQVQQVNV